MTKASRPASIDRRTILRLTVAAMASSSCGRAAISPAAARVVSADSAKAVRVALVNADNHLVALETAVDVVGGLNRVRHGDRVVLKVNTNSGDFFPYSTSPDVVRWFADQLAARGAHVVVGDRSFWGDTDTVGNFERNGIAAAARASGAKLVVFDEDEAWVDVDANLVPSWKPPVRIPKVIAEADHVINLACLKTHFITSVTLVLKNVLGIVHPVDRARPGNLRTHTQELIYAQVAEINRAWSPMLNIVDGYRALITGGPTPTSGAGPTIVEAKRIIASSDRVAADATAIALLQSLSPGSEAVTRTAVWEHPTIVAATRAGAAVKGPADLQVVTRRA